MDIEVVESLLRPENLEVSLRYVLKHATSRGSNIFELFDTSVKPCHFVASTRRRLESQGRDGAGRRTGETSGTNLGIKGPRQKLCRAPTAPLPQQSSSSARVEEDNWEMMEERQGEGLPSRTWPGAC